MSSRRRLLRSGKEYDDHDDVGEEGVERTVRVQIRQWRRATITRGGDGGMEHRWSIIIIIVKMNYNHVWVFFITIIYSGGVSITIAESISISQCLSLIESLE